VVARLVLLIALVPMLGCPSGDPAATLVSGKVTMDGQPVAGTVTFFGADNKTEVGASPIGPSGEYSIPNPTPGPVKIVVKSMAGAAGGGPLIPAPKGTTEMPKTAGGNQGVAPPVKYGSPTTTPLSYEVKKGKQTYDIQLTK